MSHTSIPTKQAGFTLVEIAIVLVIIGLLLGGVLKGQDLIASAKIKSTQQEITAFSAAIASYQDRYGAYPGDDNQAVANLGGGVTNGNGNGQIDDGERGNVFQHLVAAGLLKGSSDGTETITGYFKNEWGGTIIIDDNQAGMSGLSACYSGLDKDTAKQLDRNMDDGNSQAGDVRKSDQQPYADLNNTVCFKLN